MNLQKFIYAYSIQGFNTAVKEYLDLGYTVIPHTIVFTRLDNANYFSVFLNPPVDNTYSGTFTLAALEEAFSKLHRPEPKTEPNFKGGNL